LRGGVQHYKLQERLFVQLVIMPQLHCYRLVGIDGRQVNVCSSSAVEAAQIPLHYQP